MELSNKKSTVSVVMTTFNGETHILAQLESLLRQSLQPDEVLIFDDGSADHTVEIVNGFMEKNNLQNWKLKVNPQNLGWKRNFIEGMRQAAGDYICPCDQDDVWYPDKLSGMVKAMEQNPKIFVLAGDYHVVYESGAIPAKVYRKTASELAGETAQYRFTKHFFMNPNPGCSYCIRRSFFAEVEKYWFESAPHDEFLWLMAVVQNGAWFYNCEVMDYYRYSGNASSIRYKDIALQKENLSYIAEMLKQLEVFSERNPEKVPAEYLQHIITAQKWCAERSKLMETRNIFRWLAMAPLWGYYNSTMNCLSDLWLVVFGKFCRL